MANRNKKAMAKAKAYAYQIFTAFPNRLPRSVAKQVGVTEGTIRRWREEHVANLRASQKTALLKQKLAQAAREQLAPKGAVAATQPTKSEAQKRGARGGRATQAKRRADRTAERRIGLAGEIDTCIVGDVVIVAFKRDLRLERVFADVAAAIYRAKQGG